MTGLLDGLRLHEVILLFGGAAFFLILLFAFLSCVLKEKPLKPLLAFFAIPILMMGFPAFEKFRFDGATGQIEVLTRQLNADPSDAEARQDLEETLEDVSARGETIRRPWSA